MTYFGIFFTFHIQFIINIIILKQKKVQQLILRASKKLRQIYQKLMNANLDYDKFLNSKYPGLKLTDNLLSLITALASNMPNSTIAVKAANKNAILNISDINLKQLLRFFSFRNDNEVIDMKNGLIYYLSDQTRHGLNYDDVFDMCANYSHLSKNTASYSVGFPIVFLSDQQIRDFLNLYKMSKYFMLHWKLQNFNTIFYLMVEER